MTPEQFVHYFVGLIVVFAVIGIIFELSVPGGQETLPPLNTNKDTRSGT